MPEAIKKLTRLCSWGTSRAVRVPREVCERLGVDVGSMLDMLVGHDERGSFILIRPEEHSHRIVRDVPYRSMDELFADYEGGYRPTEPDWGNDVGGEVID